MPQKLGKHPPRWDKRTLMLSKYLDEALPAPPVACGWEFRVPSFPMMRNDTVSDCAIAAAGHMIQVWTANARKPFTPSDNDILSAYAAITGYDPQTGANDEGTVALDALNYWRNTGIAGHKIGAFVSLEPKNEDHIREALWLFGGVFIGVNLPACVQGLGVWEAPPYGPTGDGEPGGWGGHAVNIVGLGRRGLTCVTWGKLLTMSWEFWRIYCDEAYGVLSEDFLRQGVAPTGFNLSQLTNDLAALK